MGFHLQLYPPKLSAWVIVLLVLFLPAILTAYFLHNLAWLVVVPFGIIVLALFIAALPIKRKVAPEQFADELESHSNLAFRGVDTSLTMNLVKSSGVCFAPVHQKKDVFLRQSRLWPPDCILEN